MANKPNIILINCDDLGYGDLGCYGSPVNNSPFIDKMAREGLKMTDFYAASPLCSPSRGGMMTGCYPPRVSFGSFDGRGVLFPGMRLGLSDGEETMAQVLKRAGYSTMIIGKWHCGDQPEFLPTRHGFDHWYGLPYSNDMGVQKPLPGREKFHLPPLPLMEDEEILQEQPDLAGLTERYTERAVSYIRRHKDGPFFLYFAHMYVHLPIFAQEHFMKSSRNGRFGAAVETIDWSARVLVKELENLGIAENTLVIFTSDNGSRGVDAEGCSNRPLRGAKGSTWEGGQRVPCIFYWPGHIAPGQVSGELMSNIDFLPTFAAMAGEELQKEHPIDGMDMTGFLFEGEAHSPRTAFVYFLRDNLQAVRKGDYKLHVFRGQEKVKELYNLREDVGETRNVYEEHPEIAAELEEIAEQYRKTIGDAATGCPGTEKRPAGAVENPKPLTSYNPDHPYVIAMYDTEDCG